MRPGDARPRAASLGLRARCGAGCRRAGCGRRGSRSGCAAPRARAAAPSARSPSMRCMRAASASIRSAAVAPEAVAPLEVGDAPVGVAERALERGRVAGRSGCPGSACASRAHPRGFPRARAPCRPSSMRPSSAATDCSSAATFSRSDDTSSPEPAGASFAIDRGGGPGHHGEHDHVRQREAPERAAQVPLFFLRDVDSAGVLLRHGPPRIGNSSAAPEHEMERSGRHPRGAAPGGTEPRPAGAEARVAGRMTDCSEPDAAPCATIRPTSTCSRSTGASSSSWAPRTCRANRPTSCAR